MTRVWLAIAIAALGCKREPAGGESTCVTGWRGKTIVGSLNSKPQRVSKLGVGATVEVAEDEIADYVWTRADGTKEGGESIELFIERTKKGGP